MKMNTKSILAAVLFASAGFVAQSAQAATPTFTTTLNLIDSSSPFSNDIFGKNTHFVDHFVFSIGSGGDLDAGFYANQGKTDGAKITGFNLLNSLGNVVVAGSGVGGSWNINPFTIGSGSYTLEVIGDVTGKIHGSYNGTLNVSAVPEPETYGMLMAGLGLLGFAARRKAKKSA
ncbi:FxDxF family PEP-CTERM protein [Janthinobacterium sp.]|uniref:FxDxF family PEP-CTERM protein n=1 Tax=Janthinobacterium sp. TaxID=1871054 RepID=UPI00293D5A4C|nr:FxDxF family PEP-CTERM protein [Janthinobacterium sp.]